MTTIRTIESSPGLTSKRNSGRRPKQRMPLVVPLLMIGAFLMCTTENIVAGLLSQISTDLQITEARAGLLITIFAIGMAVGAPLMAIATRRLSPRVSLVGALMVFAVGHAFTALSSSFEASLVARFISAVATGAFWSVAAVAATAAAGPVLASRALGLMMSGVGLATVAGVPLGAFLGQLVGWRGTFWMLTILTVIAAAIIGRIAPSHSATDPASIVAELRSFRQVKIWLVLAATAVVSGGVMAAFSYIQPLLTYRTGLPQWTVPIALVVFGIGCLLGTNLAGRLGDKHAVITFIGATVLGTIVLALLVPFSTNTVATFVLIFLVGAAGLCIPPLATGLSIRLASAAPTLAAASAVAAYNGGVALGSWIAGYALESSLGVTGPDAVGAIMVGFGLIPLIALAILGTTRPERRDETPSRRGMK
ncbi:MFS transporter [Rhodococcus sp. NPDC057529]|uniref:MFS transporter n=1 Tax=Rhodococcus sp. NPDC057529 TaxID=3346158 RepID=UPI00366E2393